MSLSPDLSPYVDLTLYDRDPTELVSRGQLDAAVKLPGWTAPTGDLGVIFLEAFALVVAETVYAINRLPGAVAAVLFRVAFGIDLSAGVAPTTTVTFTLGDALGHTIPAGTLLRVEVGVTEPVLFTTDADVIVAPGAVVSAAVAATGTYGTALANGVPAATALDVIATDVPFVTSAVTASPIGGGAGPEDTAAWLSRARQRADRLSDALVLERHFTAFALEDPRVYRATTVAMLDPAVGPAGGNLGHVTVAVSAAGGVALSGPVMDELAAAMQAIAHPGLEVHVIAPTVTAVPVTATVRRLPGFTDAAVQANVVAALDALLDPDTWPWGAVVRRNDLIAAIEGAEGVDYLTAGHPTAPAADVALAGYAPLADAGVLTITVTAP